MNGNDDDIIILQEDPVDGEVVGTDLIDQNDIDFIINENDTKKKVRDGLMALNDSLFEQVLHEATRVPDIRKIVYKIEGILLEDSKLSNLTPEQLIKVWDISRKSMDSSLNFMERMYKLSLNITGLLEVYKEMQSQVVDTGKDPAEKKDGKLIDKKKVFEAKRALLAKLSK